MYSPATTSDSIAVGTASVTALPGLLCNLVLNPGTAASSVTLYDNASGAASGKVVWSLVAAANGPSIPVTFSVPVVFNLGLSIVVAGTAATAVVSFTNGR